MSKAYHARAIRTQNTLHLLPPAWQGFCLSPLSHVIDRKERYMLAAASDLALWR